MKSPRLYELPAPPSDKKGWPWSEESRGPSLLTKDDSAWVKISVIIPSFNQGEFIEETIRSVLLQNYPNYECVIIDGKSRDQTQSILSKYDPWITYWRSEKDGGQSDAINCGLKQCTGDLVTFLGADDLCSPETFCDLAKQWKNHPESGVLTGWFQIIDKQSVVMGDVYQAFIKGQPPMDMTLLSDQGYRIHQVATYYSHRALKDVGCYVRDDLAYTMDRELLYRILRAYPVSISKTVYGQFRNHGGNKSHEDYVAFGREFAQIYRAYKTKNILHNFIRHLMAQQKIYKGYMKQIGHLDDRWGACLCLAQAIWTYPLCLISYQFYYSIYRHTIRKRMNSVRQGRPAA